MDRRKEDLLKLRSYTEEIDKDLTMILQSLQWDRKHILQHPTMVSCKYDSNHKVMCGKAEEHERECLLQQNGYLKDEYLLPDPLDVNSSTLITLGKEDITHIIENAAKSDPSFKKVCVDTLYGCIQLYLLYISGALAPQSLGRLQCAYSADERRAIHDAVVNAAPACHDLTDLALTSTGDDQQPKTKSRTEILAELRDMRRRRTKYRVAAKSRNYSDVLRDVIKTQMEHYNEVLGDTKPDVEELNASIEKQKHGDRNDNTQSQDRENRDKHERRRELSRYDKDKERSRKEHSDRGRRESRYEREDKGNRERSREKRPYGRYEKDRRLKELEARNDDYINRNRSKETKYRRKSKEKEYGESRDRVHKRQERHSDREPESSRRRLDDDYYRDNHNKEKRKEEDRRKDEARQDVPDEERARNLLIEIKQEIEAVEDDNGNNKDESTYRSSIEVKHEKRYRDYITKGNGHQRHDAVKDKYRHRERDSDKDDLSEERNGKYREREDNSYKKKHKKSKDDRIVRHRDRSSDKEFKKSRTEDKHRIYYEIYSELDSRRNKYDSK